MTVYKGWNVDVRMGTEVTGTVSTELVGKAQSMSVEISNSVEAIHGIGSREPCAVREGPVEISGSLERMYFDERLFDVINPGTETSYLTLQGDIEEGDRVIECQGVKFDSWSVDMPQDDFVSESVDFQATAITIKGNSVETLGVQGEEFEIQDQEDVEEETFTCETCGFTSNSEQGIKTHQRVHEEDE